MNLTHVCLRCQGIQLIIFVGIMFGQLFDGGLEQFSLERRKIGRRFGVYQINIDVVELACAFNLSA